MANGWQMTANQYCGLKKYGIESIVVSGNIVAGNYWRIWWKRQWLMKKASIIIRK